ncbi:rhamnogalacturonan acetylesterase [Halalkalibacter alkalisediminis]|uniref:Rhamnogalacturonan acetylesterase n=1 Tax=Halalkalibacter alkalisediminis TaxID=935616 RepID=A0ABV6NCA5_9BACI|nr:rhamnogalacturonan acetylesterase [Halalkalibacter alkalisediminis]
MSNINVFIAGDSTASSYAESRSPRAGWGQVLGRFFTSNVTVHNHASSGRSSKSFIDEGRLKVIEAQLMPGDYFLIQFGHNDAKVDKKRYTDPESSYKYYLTHYIEVAHKKGAHPIFLTSIQRRSFDDDGRIIETHGQYPVAMKKLAEEKNVPLIDLTLKSKILFEQLGPDQTKQLFLWIEPGEHPNYVQGIQDDTHFSEYGAREMVELIIEGITEQSLPLARYITEGGTYEDG